MSAEFIFTNLITLVALVVSIIGIVKSTKANGISKEANNISKEALKQSSFSYKKEIAPTLSLSILATEHSDDPIFPYPFLLLQNLSHGKANITKILAMGSSVEITSMPSGGFSLPTELLLNGTISIGVKLNEMTFSIAHKKPVIEATKSEVIETIKKGAIILIEYNDSIGTLYRNILWYREQSNSFEGLPQELINSNSVSS